MPKGQHGGKRNGSGRKKGVPAPQTAEKVLRLEQFRQRVWAEYDPLLTAQMQMAKGVFVMLAKTESGWKEVTDPKAFKQYVQTGEGFIVAQKPPDPRVLKDTFDRAIGQPTQVVELGGAANSDPILIRHVFAVEGK